MNLPFRSISAMTAFGTVLAAVLLSGCTDETGNDSESNLLEAQQQAIDRARSVEQDVADAARRRTEEIDGAENDG